jgi:toxin ParE1/3/4
MTTKRRSGAPSQPIRTRAPLQLRWTVRAIADLEEIGDYISRDKPVAAARWVHQLIAVAERAALAPLSGRRVPELARDDIRELRRRTYRVVYRVTETHVDVLTVFEGHRLLPDDVVVPDAGTDR